MTRPRPVAVVLMVIAAVVLAGCSGAPPVTRPTGPPATTAPATPTPAGPDEGPGPDELAAAKQAAGIVDCPTSDPTADPRPDGLPDLTLSCLGGGREVRLAGLRGRPHLINVWAQWCGPCRTEAPFLTEGADRWGEQVGFVGIDYADPQPGRAIAFAAEAGWRYPQLADVEGTTRAPLQVVGPPLSLFVDADGVVVARHVGPFTSTEQLGELLAEHLGVST